MSRVLNFEITDAGLSAAFDPTNTSFASLFGFIGLGTGQPYTPTGTETALRSEFMRRPVATGERIASNEIALQSQFTGPEEGLITEVGLFTADGTLFAVWSGSKIGDKVADVPYLFAHSLVLDGINLNRYGPAGFSWTAAGPNVNIIIAGPFAILAAEVVRAHRLGISAERARATPLIQNLWS